LITLSRDRKITANLFFPRSCLGQLNGKDLHEHLPVRQIGQLSWCAWCRISSSHPLALGDVDYRERGKWLLSGPSAAMSRLNGSGAVFFPDPDFADLSSLPFQGFPEVRPECVLVILDDKDGKRH
jgi:hypothetical protein